MVGGPDSGKSNYLARLWAALLYEESDLHAPIPPEKVTYVEGLLAHLNQGKFVGRSDPTLENGPHDLTIKVVSKNDSAVGADLLVPDVLGEMWNGVVGSSEMPQHWYERMRESNGALLFVRAHSKINYAPLDWVTSQKLLKAGLGSEPDAGLIPTQVFLSELLRVLRDGMSRRTGLPRIAIVVSAWDGLDPLARSSSPMKYFEKQFPLFAGRLKDEFEVEMKIFGLSIVGGDIDGDEQFRSTFLEQGIRGSGYVVYESDSQVKQEGDITLPVKWLLNS